MAASGFAGLGLQIVWTQQSALWLGHENVAVLAVVAAFFGGIAVGALSLGGRIDQSTRPAFWYAACEAIIGVWSLALIFGMAPISGWLLDAIGAQSGPLRHWSIAFCGTFLLLLPATAAMGATLPAMERIVATLQSHGAPIAQLYAANTIGAVVGVLVTAFVLIPRFGLSFTVAICASSNVLCAAVARKVFAPRYGVALRPLPVNPQSHLILLAITGLLGISYEVLVVRVLSQVAENTVFTFAILLAVYLVGTSLGAVGYGRWAKGAPARADLRDRLLRWLCAACLSGVVCLAFAADMKSTLLRLIGPGMTTALMIEAMLAVIAFLLPTIVMGALFSHLATEARRAGISFARAIGVNTLGAALAPLVCGLLLLPSLGSTTSLLLVAVGYLLFASPRAWRSRAQLIPAAAATALAIWAPSLALIELPRGGRLVSFTEGAAATVSVVEDARGVATLHINNRQQEGSSATLLADGRQGLLPILLHPAPRRALFLGLGTGVTVRTAARDAALQLDAVELLPEVIAASSYFATSFGGPDNPRLRLLTADARRFVRTAPDLYDVIVADNFHPARSGSGALYTVEHFAAVRNRLASGGVFCQWLPLHQLDMPTLRSIVRAYLRVYPRGWAMLATHSLETPVLGLVSRRDGERIDVQALRQRLVTAQMSRSLTDFGITDDLSVFGTFVAGATSLESFAGDAPVNTDDHPVVTYLAPRITYAPTSAPRDRLLELLSKLESKPDELLENGDEEWLRRLAAYWKARNHYLALGRDVRPTFDVRDMLSQVREPLLSVLHISPDFRPAYDPLLQMAQTLALDEPSAARVLLGQLVREQPARPEAINALRALAISP
jgi:spermidine synthase